MKTGLLVSVRSGDEALDALRGGADLIDIKEPNHGSLGAADPTVWRDVFQTVEAKLPLSVALGELTSADLRPDLSQESCLSHFNFAKVGLANCCDITVWADRLVAFMRRLPDGVTPVAVAYADYEVARSPSPTEVLRVAIDHGFGGLLLDTYDKSGRNLFDYLELDNVVSLIDRARNSGLATVVGGSLKLPSIETALECRADYIAVRGAACRGARIAHVDESLVRELADLVHGHRLVARS